MRNIEPDIQRTGYLPLANGKWMRI